jgi:hypothetical protein
VPRNFNEVENGWIRWYPSKQAIARAQARAAETADLPVLYANNKNRWVGFLFEETLSSWFSEEGIPHKLNGGYDNKPDLQVGRREIAAKSKHLAWVPSPGEIVLAWPEPKKMRDSILWGLYRVEYREMFILGSITPKRLRRIGKRVKKGEIVYGTVEADVPHIVISAADLDRPLPWLQDLYVEEVQFAD